MMRRSPAGPAQQLSLFDALPDVGRPRPALAGRPRASVPALRQGSSCRVAVLGSGSSGNAVLVESAGRRLLIDAGFSCRELERRLKMLGVEAESLGGVLLTHEHGDHARGAERLARRFGLDVYATAGTLRSGCLGRATGRAKTVVSGRPFEVAGFEIEAFAIPHDAREPVGFVVEDEEGSRLGLVADLGARSQLAWGRLQELDVLLLEANHDLEMLRAGPYPWSLKQRVASRHGHLSNRDAAEGLPELVCDRLRWVVLYHLSRTNNLPALASDLVGEVLSQTGSEAHMLVCEQERPSEWLTLRLEAAPTEAATVLDEEARCAHS